MAREITIRTRSESERINKTPNIILEIEGVDGIFSAVDAKRLIKIGDPGLKIGDFTIGGLAAILDQSNYISFQAGTSSQISQVIKPDEGKGDTVTRLQIGVVDKNGEVTNLLKPGQVVNDILGKKAKVWFGFSESEFKKDYLVIHRGFIDDIKSSPGLVTFNVASSERLKKSDLFLKAETNLTAPASSGDSSISVSDTSDFLFPVLGPDGSQDETLTFFVRINDEIMRYESGTATSFDTLTRGELNTIATSHSSGATVESFYRIGPDDVINIALKILLGGKEGFYQESVPISNFIRVEQSELIENSIYFKGLNIIQEYNIAVGDFVTTTGATEGANNISSVPITGIVVTNNGSYLTVDNSVTLVEENNSSALIDFRSQYDVWPNGAGLGLLNDEVDIDQHLDIRQNVLSSFQYDFYIKDTIDAKEFLSSQVYNPASAISLPRKARSSVIVQQPPLPGQNIKTIDSTNVLNSNKLKVERTVNKNFFNNIRYIYEESPLEDKFFRNKNNTDADSIQRIEVRLQTLEIKSKGLRDFLSAESISSQAATRRLRKYKFGAEFIRNVLVNNETGFDIEAGDSIILDTKSLKISDSRTGTRNGEQRIFSIDNWKLNLKTGQVSLDIVDTNQDQERFGLIGPSSKIKSASSTSKFIIKASFSTFKYGINEWKKWEDLIGASVIIRNSDFSIFDTSIISEIQNNEFTLENPLSFVPLEDYIMELDDYSNQNDRVKLLFTFMTDGATFPDGTDPYVMF